MVSSTVVPVRSLSFCQLCCAPLELRGAAASSADADKLALLSLPLPGALLPLFCSTFSLGKESWLYLRRPIRIAPERFRRQFSRQLRRFSCSRAFKRFGVATTSLVLCYRRGGSSSDKPLSLLAVSSADELGAPVAALRKPRPAAPA